MTCRGDRVLRGPEPEQTKVLPLAPLHMRLGCRTAEVHGWLMPLWYEGALVEQQLTRERAAVFDRSHLGRFLIIGGDAHAVLGRVLASDPRRVPVGSAQRAVACRDDGTILDIPTLCRLAADRWLVVTGPCAAEELRTLVERALEGADAEVLDRSRQTAFISLQGPWAREVFDRVFGSDFLDSVERTGHSEALLGLPHAEVVRGSHVGEEGFWWLLNPEVASDIWRAFVDAGAISAGLVAHDALRLEAGVLEAPAETAPAATPEAAGLDALVGMTDRGGRRRDREFAGARTLRSASPLARRAVGLRLDGGGTAHVGSRVSVDGVDIGVCIAAASSVALGVDIAVAYLRSGLGRVDLETDGERTAATVVPLPFVSRHDSWLRLGELRRLKSRAGVATPRETPAAARYGR